LTADEGLFRGTIGPGSRPHANWRAWALTKSQAGPFAEPASSGQKISYRPDVDGLRAIAVLAVLAFHAYPKVLPSGFVGVDVFFVISGYLISSILISDLKCECFSFAKFYAARIRRIFPALVLVLALCLIAGWFVLFGEEYTKLGKHVAGGAEFLANFILLSEVGYFDTEASTKPLLHLWSLGVEEQFYLVWPALLWIGGRLRANLLLLIILFGFG
jgi:peptidoglycan/LPS O-acetylase OafA/YrhL